MLELVLDKDHLVVDCYQAVTAELSRGVWLLWQRRAGGFGSFVPDEQGGLALLWGLGRQLLPIWPQTPFLAFLEGYYLGQIGKSCGFDKAFLATFTDLPKAVPF